MTHRSRQRTIALLLLAAGTWLATACGGRFRTISDVTVDDDTAAGQSSAGAASTGRAGAATGGKPSAGAPGGGAQGAGAPSGGAPSAGAGGCGNVNCPLIKCAAGYEPVVLPGKCCPVCQASCQEVMCPGVACPSNTHLEVPPGQCCPVCVDDAGYQCSKGKELYAEQRAQFLDKYSRGCASASDCTVVAPMNQCEPGCQYEAVWKGAASFFSENLSSLASMSCANCGVQPIPPCLPPAAPFCINGQCLLGVK